MDKFVKYSLSDAVNFQFEKAKEALTDATYLLENERWNAGTNRLYYACFYAVSAYLILKDITAKTHTGTKSKFNELLIKTELVDNNYGDLFNQLFDLRQGADYEIFYAVQEDEILPKLEKASYFIDKMISITNKEMKV